MATTLEQLDISSLHPKDTSEETLTFEPFSLPSTNQRILGAPHPPNTPIPLALQLSLSGNTKPTLECAIRNNQRPSNARRHSPPSSQNTEPSSSATSPSTPSPTSAPSRAFGYRPHEIVGIVVDRPFLAPNVATANEAPKEVRIYSHNESPQVPHAPEYIFIYAHKVPKKGGKTPISSSLELFHRARPEMPQFIDLLAEEGGVFKSRVTYTVERQYEFVDGDDEKTKRVKVEAQVARYGRGEYTTSEWSDDADSQGQVLTLSHHLLAIRTQPDTNLPFLFAGLAAYYKNSLEASKGSSAGRKNVAVQTFRDGTPIPEEYLATSARITDEIRVLHRWQEGEVLVLDNAIAQHGREPWEGEKGDRVVLASLFDGESPSETGKGFQSQLNGTTAPLPQTPAAQTRQIATNPQYALTNRAMSSLCKPVIT
ncbi:hypothetical protein BDW68DRAFT_190988 [Aspergillus falconensis]